MSDETNPPGTGSDEAKAIIPPDPTPTKLVTPSAYNENDAAQRILVGIFQNMHESQFKHAGQLSAELVRLLNVKGYKIVSSQT